MAIISDSHFHNKLDPKTLLPLMLVLSVISVGLGYSTSILAARLLGPAEYEDFMVTVASLGILAAVAESGVGKLALKTMPAYKTSEQWSLASGYWRFSLRIVLCVSMLLLVSVVTWEWVEDDHFADHPLGIAVLFLPAIVLSGIGIDFIMANRAAVTGALIARLVVPGTTVLLFIAAEFLTYGLSLNMAVVGYGAGSVIGALLCAQAFRQTSPANFFSAKPKYHSAEWLRECIYFATFAFLSAWIFRIAIIVLELLPIAELQTAYLAAAMQTGYLVLLLAKSTDKLFQPELSVIIQQESWELGAKLRRKRFLFVGTGCTIFLLIIFFFGKQILGLHGTEFEAGYPALCFISLGTCTWTMFSLAPAYLNFTGRNMLVVVTTIVGAVILVILTAILGLFYGSTGAGIAICIVLSGIAGVFFVTANSDFLRRKESRKKN